MAAISVIDAGSILSRFRVNCSSWTLCSSLPIRKNDRSKVGRCSTRSNHQAAEQWSPQLTALDAEM